MWIWTMFDSGVIVLLFAVGMKMVADMEQFSGVNDAVLKQAVSAKKMEIESKLREASRLQLCQVKKVSIFGVW
jgi:hypothetical protein